jgi:hypothetical protein
VTHRYRFGPIVLESVIPLPELVTAQAGIARISIEPATVDAAGTDWYHRWTFETGDVHLVLGRAAAGYVLRFPGLADFAIDADGCRVRVSRGDATDSTFRHLLIDQVLPLALSHQGELVLHAGAVATASAAVAFLGATGRGKSTMTASLAARGLSAISDDTLILSFDAEGRMLAHPTYPSLRMWPDTATAVLTGGWSGSGRVSDFNDKVRVGSAGGLDFGAAASPLAAIYLLTPDDAVRRPAIEPLPSRERVLELIRHAFVLDWRLPHALRDRFDRLATIATHVPVRRLRFRHDYDALALAHRLILDDIGALVA